MFVWQAIYLLGHLPASSLSSLFFVKSKKQTNKHTVTTICPALFWKESRSYHTLVYQAKTIVSDSEMTEGLPAILGERWCRAHLIVMETETQKEERCQGTQPEACCTVRMEDVLSGQCCFRHLARTACMFVD